MMAHIGHNEQILYKLVLKKGRVRYSSLKTRADNTHKSKNHTKWSHMRVKIILGGLKQQNVWLGLY